MLDIVNRIEKYDFCQTTEFDQILQENAIKVLKSKQILIYGAGSLGRILYTQFKKNEIEVCGFVDRAAKSISFDLPGSVYPPEYLCEIVNKEDYVIVIALNHLQASNQIRSFLEEYVGEIITIKGFELNRMLRFGECKKKLNENVSFDLVDCAKCGFEERGCVFCDAQIRNRMEVCTEDVALSGNFDWLGYIVGQVCTLKCKHCCEGVPYIGKGKFVEVDRIINDLDKISASCKFVKYVELIGGEPFLHPQFELVLKRILDIKNIGYIKIFTNGTVIPSDSLCRILRDSRIVVHMSNYTYAVSETLKGRINKTRETLAIKGINYIFIDSTNWLDFTEFKRRDSSDEELTKYFKDCFLSNCHRLHDGILYRCPHQYAGVQKNMLDLVAGEHIYIHELDQKSLAQELEKFEMLKFTEACRYCNMPYDAPEIVTGIQLE